MTYEEYKRIWRIIMRDEIATAKVRGGLKGISPENDLVLAYLHGRIRRGNGGRVPKALKPYTLKPVRLDE